MTRNYAPIYDVGMEHWRNDEVLRADVEIRALDRRFGEADAVNLSNMARYYLNMSPDVAAGLTELGVPWDTPSISQLAFKDAQQQERPWWDLLHQGSRLVGGVRPAVRGAFAFAEGMWEEGIPRLSRTVIQQYQNPESSWVDSWRRAGASDISYAAGELAQGNRVHWGEGWFPQPAPMHEIPGFGDDMQTRVQADVERGIDPAQSYQQNFAQLTGEYHQQYGRNIVYEGQRIRHSTLISRTRNGQTYTTPYSLGRLAAVQVATPGTTAFNMLSGGIDGFTRIAWDPLNIPADEVRRWNQARNLILPANAVADGTVVLSNRKWVNPKLFEEWLTTGRGARRITYLADETSIPSILDAVPGISVRDAIRISQVSDEASVINLLRPYMQSGVKINKYPSMGRLEMLGHRVTNSDGFVSHFQPQLNSVSSWWNRMTAHTTNPIINPWDPDTSVRTIRQYLDTVGASVDDQNRVIKALSRAANDPNRTRRAVRELEEVVKDRLLVIGYDDIEVESIMKMYRDVQALHSEYLVDLAKNPVVIEGTGQYAIPLPDGTEIMVDMRHAATDAELAQQLIMLPNIRDLRIGTSRIKSTMNRWRKHIGDDKRLPFSDNAAFRGAPTVLADKVSSVWRNFALLRGGWTVRIIAEEAVRRNAAGYGLLINDPASAIALVMDTNMRGITGLDTLDDYFRMHSLGASGFGHYGDNLPRLGTEWDGAKTSYAVVRTTDDIGELTDVGRRALTMDIHLTAHSILHQKVMQLGVDDAVVWFQDNPEILRQIKQDAANRGSNLNQIVDHPMAEYALRRQLEALEWDATILGGGNGYRRNPHSQVWLDAGGQDLLDPRQMNRNELNALLDTYGLPHRRSRADAVADLWDELGYNLDEMDESGRQFWVSQEAPQPFRNLIATGDTRQTVVRTADGGVEFAAVDDDLVPSLAIVKEDTPGFRRAELDFEMRVGELYQDVIPPAHRRMPSTKLDRPGRQGFVEMAFHALGEVPTTKLIRSPFAKMRYTEEMARAYLWSDNATRRALRSWADENGVRGLFDDFVGRHRKDYGLKKLPTGIEEPFDDFASLDDLVKQKVVADTKDLFYDLTQKQNWADAMRFIFPFADAWQEVLSRWIKMMSGFGPGGPGQAIRNWERLRQGLQAVNTSSFFGEDQFGNMTFNFPAAGFLSPALRDQTRWRVRPEQLLFIDPTIRGISGPGTGPLVQAPAMFFKPQIEKYIGQEAADTMDAFLFGDYSTPRLGRLGETVKVFLPSWLKRTIDHIYEDENTEAVADEIVQYFSALLHSQDPRFVAYDNESMRKTMMKARDLGGTMSLARIADAMILPALPRYEPSVFVELADHPDAGFWLNMVALGAEERRAEEFFGDPEVAAAYIMSKFGLNPVNTINKTYSLFQYPTSQQGLAYLREHPELPDTFRYTLMMFTPEGTDTNFYYPSWEEAIAEGARAVTTPEMAMQIPSRQAGRADWNQRMLEYDSAKEQAARRFGTDSQTFRNYMKELEKWKEFERRRIDAEYWSWDQPIAEQQERPTYERMFEELREAVKPGSQANQLGNQLNRDMVDFLDFALGLWDQAEDISNERGYGHDWWRTSTAQSFPNAQDVYNLRQWFFFNVEGKIASMPEGQAKIGAEWVTEYLFARLVEGAEWDDEWFIDVEEPPAPLPAYAASPLDINDEQLEEIDGPVGLEMTRG